MGLGIRSQGARFPDHVNALCLERWARGGVRNRGAGGCGLRDEKGIGYAIRPAQLTDSAQPKHLDC